LMAVAGVGSGPAKVGSATRLVSFTCNTGQMCIHSTQVPTTAPSFEDSDLCADFTQIPGEDFWHFVLPGNDANFDLPTTNFNAIFDNGPPTPAASYGGPAGQPRKFAYVYSAA